MNYFIAAYYRCCLLWYPGIHIGTPRPDYRLRPTDTLKKLVV